MADGTAGIDSNKRKLSGYVYSTDRAILNGAKVTCDEFETLTSMGSSEIV